MKRLFSILFFLPLFSFCQNTKIYSENPSILKYIKPSYKNILDLLTANDGCKFLNKDSSLFTGKAYSIEYISDYYFLSSSPDSSVCRVKIIEFKNGLRDGICNIIDPFYSKNINQDGQEKTEEFIEIKSNLSLPDSQSLEKQIVFIFNFYNIEYGDLSEYISFQSYSFYDLNGKKLNDIEIDILGDDWSMRQLAKDKYLNKYLKLTLLESLGKSGEQYGHYVSDKEMFYYSVPPYYCGKSINISKIEILEDFMVVDE